MANNGYMMDAFRGGGGSVYGRYGSNATSYGGRVGGYASYMNNVDPSLAHDENALADMFLMRAAGGMQSRPGSDPYGEGGGGQYAGRVSQLIESIVQRLGGGGGPQYGGF